MKNFYKFFKEKVKEHPDMIYLIDSVNDVKVSYAEADINSDKAANYLINSGLKKGDIISVVMGNTLEYIYLVLGAFKAGIVVNPFNPRLSEEEINSMIEFTNPKMVFKEFSLGDYPLDFEGNDASLDDEMLLLYSSGTTGKPKGIVLTQGNVLNGLMNGIESIKLRKNPIIFDLLPLYFSGGLLPSLFVPLYLNGSTIITPKFDKNEFWRIIEKHKANLIYVVPTMLNMLLDTEALDINSVDFIINSSDYLPKGLSKKFKEKFKVPLYDIYGLSETLAITIRTEDNDSVGKLIKGMEIKFVDNEIVVKGPTIMKKYFRMPDETSKVLKNRWFYTGDLGYIDEGNLYITGRKKDVIIKGGMNISPNQITEVFLKHSKVEDCATVGIPDEKYGEDILVFIVGDVSKEELIEFAKEHLNTFKIPKEIRFIDKIPKNHLGKVLKKELIRFL